MVPTALFRPIKAVKEPFQRRVFKKSPDVGWNCHRDMIWTWNKFPLTLNSPRREATKGGGTPGLRYLTSWLPVVGHGDLGRVSSLP